MKLLEGIRRSYHSWSRQRLLRQLCQKRLYTTDVINNREENELLVRAVDRISDNLYRKFLVAPDQPLDSCMLRVAVIGAPNAGKSTVVNSLMGWKVHAVSSKVHTTRKNTNGMMTEGKTQIGDHADDDDELCSSRLSGFCCRCSELKVSFNCKLFVDTPGVLTAMERKKHFCDGQMVTDPEKSVHDVDIVGVVVDVSNKWTRNQLHVELLKVLHLHSTVPSFLILNKVDCLKWKQLTLDVTRKLTCGIVNGRPMAFSTKLKVKPTSLPQNSDPSELFDELERKYGTIKSLRHKKEQKDGVLNETKGFEEESEKSDKQWITDFAAELKRHAENAEREKRINENNSGKIINKNEEKVKSKDFSENISQQNNFSQSENSYRSLEETYQSDFLLRILDQPERVCRAEDQTDDEDAFDWTQKVAKIKEATIAAKKNPGWKNFDRVFIVSALHGEGMQDIKDYLMSKARPGDWQYHSSLVTDQDPKDLATMCVWQALLDHCTGAIPYMVYPDIVYWNVGADDRLSIIMEISVKNSYLAENIIGKNGTIIKAVTADAKQALLNAFRCDVQFKLVVKVKKGSGKR